MTPDEELFEELFVLAESLKKAASGSADDAVDKPVSALEQAARNVGRSFSGSWQGYHSRVYYAGFATPRQVRTSVRNGG